MITTPGETPNWLTESPDGIILSVRVQPKARRNAVEGVHNARIKVKVTAPPSDGRANEAVLDLLATTFDVMRSRMTLVAGAASRDKRVLLRDVTAEEAAARFAAR